jgi:hypothetical protein
MQPASLAGVVVVFILSEFLYDWRFRWGKRDLKFGIFEKIVLGEYVN